MHENMTEAAKLAGVDFTINVVQTENGIAGRTEKRIHNWWT